MEDWVYKRVVVVVWPCDLVCQTRCRVEWDDFLARLKLSKHLLHWAISRSLILSWACAEHHMIIC